jgi:tetratricopeptide (TPR) repeat protein
MRQSLVKTASLRGSLLDGKYRLEELIRDEANGSFWSAIHEPSDAQRLWYGSLPPSIGERFIVYRCCLSGQGDSATFRRAFYEGLSAINPATESGIQGVVDFGIDSKAAYLVYEDRRLQDLASQHSSYDPLQKLHLLARIASFLQGVHDQLSKPLPLRPENLRASVGGEGQGDLYVGGLLDSLCGIETTLITVADEVEDLAAIKYCAPEVLFGDSLDVRSDIFAFGVLAYELLFPAGNNDTFIKEMQSLHLEQKNSSRLEINLKNCVFGEERGVHIAEEIRSCLDFNPAFRPKSIAELAVRLLGACGGSGSEIAERFITTKIEQATELQRIKPREPQPRTNKRIVYVGILAFVLVLFFPALSYWKANHSDSRRISRSFHPALQSEAAEILANIKQGEEELVKEVEQLRWRISEVYRTKGAVSLAAEVEPAINFRLLQAEAEVRGEHLETYRRWISGERSGLRGFEKKVRKKRVTPSMHATLVRASDAVTLLEELYEKKLALVIAKIEMKRDESGDRRRKINVLLKKVDSSLSVGDFYGAVQILDNESVDLLSSEREDSEKEESSTEEESSSKVEQGQSSVVSSESDDEQSEVSIALRRAMRLRAATLHSQAIEVLEPFLLRDDLSRSDKSAVLFALGRSYYKKREFIKAEEVLQSAVEIDPKRADYHFTLGNVFLFSKRYPNAIDSYERALKLSPKTVSYLSNLGIALKRNGQSKRSTEILKKAIALDPDSAIVKEALAESSRISREERK